MAGVGEKLLDQGFTQPTGLLGRLGGRLMVRGNAATERHLVQVAACQPGESVLVVGPGPGVGVQELLRLPAHVVAVDPSTLMLESTLRRCRALAVADGRLTLRVGTAQDHGAASGTLDAALSVNNVMIWPDRRAGLAALFDALRPGGRLVVSAHKRWLPDGLADDCAAVGFTSVESWDWDPPVAGGHTAVQVRAVRA